MFDLSTAYTGAMIAPEQGADGVIAADNPAHSYQIDTEKLILDAREQADAILNQAREEAASIKQEILDNAHLEAEALIATSAAKASTDLGLDLWSARNAIAHIVEQSLNNMIGDIGEVEACYMAVERAARDYVSTQKFTVHAEPETANRLRLLQIGQAGKGYSVKYEIVDDHNIPAQRCMLDMGHKRVEVSLEAQIQAVKNASLSALQRVNVKQDPIKKSSGNQIV